MSNLVEHAKRELKLSGETDEEYIAGILKVIQAFADAGHSGGSASVAIPTINELLQFHPLTPLTSNPAEWNEVGDGVWQSVRNSEAFSTDVGVSYYLVSEMTPYYESDPYHATEPDPGPTPDPNTVAGTTASGNTASGDTVLPITVVSDQPPTAQ